MRIITDCLRGLLVLCVFFCFNISNAQPLSWQSRGVGGGGALFFPTINPGNDNEFYVACDMSQLFHSTDFGNSYTQVPFTKMQVGGTSTYEFTNNNNIAYCIANDGNINFGVRTIDGGNSWQPLPGNPLNGEDVYALKADYNNPARVVLDYYGAIYISNDTAKSFTLVRNASNGGSGITLAGVFFDGSNIYIGTNEGVLYSSNGGTSFSLLATSGITAGQSIFSFAGAKVGATTRFFCITANTGDIHNGIAPYEYYQFAKGVYSMDAGSNVWTARTTGINFATDFVMYVGMARNDINTVYLGGSDDNTGGNLVMKTTNAGGNWSKVLLTTNNQNIRTGWSGHGGDRGWGYGESCFGISVAPNNSNKVLFSDFGFVHRTTNGGTNWQQAYVNPADEHPAGSATPQDRYYRSIGIENTTAWQIHWQDANNMFACFSDINGIRSTNGGISWSFDYTGHSVNTMYRIAKHTSNNTMFAATSGVHDMYQSTRLQDNLLDANDAGGRIIYSTNNGAAWSLLHQFNHPVFWVATDPTNPNRLYASVIHYNGGAGDGGIWVTNNLDNLSTSVWSKLPNPPRTQGHPASIVVLNDGKVVCTYSGRRTSGGTFTASSGVFLYDPALGTWADLSHADMQYWTKDIVIDPSDPTQNTWYVAVFSGWGGAPNGRGGLFRSTNRGASWTKLTGTQFDRVTSITFNPVTPAQAYLTTEVQGLWISNNMNAATPTWSLVANYEFRQPERVFFNPFNLNEVWVTSFGNGLKVGTLAGALPTRLITFTGNRNGNVTNLQWSTAQEETGTMHRIERSTDGKNFTPIGTIIGNAGNRNDYDFRDIITASKIYYRVVLIDAGTNPFHSRILSFNTSLSGANTVKLAGNPVRSMLNLQVNASETQAVDIVIVHVNGAIVMQNRVAVNAGVNQLSVALPSRVIPGNYIVKVKGATINSALKVLVSK
jgi:hypothetical protein